MPPQTMNRQHPMQIRNFGLPAAPRTAALQEQSDNLPGVGSFFSASCFHLCGQHQDWWLSLATGIGSVPTTLRRLLPKHCHRPQVLARRYSLPLKLRLCCRWYSRAPSVSFLLLVYKQGLPKATVPPQPMDLFVDSLCLFFKVAAQRTFGFIPRSCH